jgi:hypothetical protein
MAWMIFLSFLVSIPGTIFGLAGIICFINSSEYHLTPEQQGEKMIVGTVMLLVSAVFIYFTHLVYSSAVSAS